MSIAVGARAARECANDESIPIRPWDGLLQVIIDALQEPVPRSIKVPSQLPL